ncbi:hypothetical protein ACJ41O_006733 [Fusarium nematophilum]
MGDTVHVEVGSGSGARWFQVKRSHACSASGAFARFSAESDPGDAISFDSGDPDVFEMFCSWLDVRQPQSLPDPEVYLEEPWLSRTAQAWLLATGLEAPGFAHFCLKTFIRNCAISPIGPWRLIEQQAGEKSPLRRFSNHWVAWNVSLLQQSEGSEYCGLAATALARQVDEYTADPRGYAVAHWYRECSDRVSPRCHHNPRVVEEEKRRACSPSPPPPKKEGRSVERQRMRSRLGAAP